MAIKSYVVELTTELPLMLDTSNVHDEIQAVMDKTQEYLDDNNLSDNHRFHVKIVGVQTETTN